eukprot:9155561-Ditylum_brightwellii.AAC.1
MVGGSRYFEIAGSMPGFQLNRLKPFGSMDFGIRSSNTSATLDDYDWFGQSRSFVCAMIHNDDGSTNSEGNLLSIEEGSVAVEFLFGGTAYIRGFGCDYGNLPGTIVVDNSASLDLNEYNL